jgi:hypothetical protein
MRTEIKALFLGAAAVTWSIALLGCPGKLRDPGRFTDGGIGGAGGGTSCPDVPTEILAMKCAGSTCHSGAMPAQGLDLVSAGVESRVVGKMASECMAPLADPAAPDTSIIYVKVAGETCGSRMPLGAPLADSEVACIKSWIAGLTPGGATSSGSGTGAGGAGGMAGTTASSSSTGP